MATITVITEQGKPLTRESWTFRKEEDGLNNTPQYRLVKYQKKLIDEGIVLFATDVPSTLKDVLIPQFVKEGLRDKLVEIARKAIVCQ